MDEYRRIFETAERLRPGPGLWNRIQENAYLVPRTAWAGKASWWTEPAYRLAATLVLASGLMLAGFTLHQHLHDAGLLGWMESAQGALASEKRAASENRSASEEKTGSTADNDDGDYGDGEGTELALNQKGARAGEPDWLDSELLVWQADLGELDTDIEDTTEEIL